MAYKITINIHNFSINALFQSLMVSLLRPDVIKATDRGAVPSLQTTFAIPSWPSNKPKEAKEVYSTFLPV